MEKLKTKSSNKSNPQNSKWNKRKDSQPTRPVSKGKYHFSNTGNKYTTKQTKSQANKENIVDSYKKGLVTKHGPVSTWKDIQLLKKVESEASDHSVSLDSLEPTNDNAAYRFKTNQEERKSIKMNNLENSTTVQNIKFSSSNDVKITKKKQPPHKLHLFCTNMNNSYHGSTGESLFSEPVDSDSLKRSSSDPNIETFPNGERVVESTHVLTNTLLSEAFVGTRETWGPLKKHDSFEVLEDWCNRSLTKGGGHVGKDTDRNDFTDLIEFVEENGLDICGSVGESTVVDELPYFDDVRNKPSKDSFEMLEEWCKQKDEKDQVITQKSDDNDFMNKAVASEISSACKENTQTNYINGLPSSINKQTNASLSMTNCLLDMLNSKNEDLKPNNSNSTGMISQQEKTVMEEESLQTDLSSSYVCVRSNKIIDCSKRKDIPDNASTDCDESLSLDSLDNTKETINAHSHSNCLTYEADKCSQKSDIESQHAYLPVPVVFHEKNFVPSPKMVRKLTIKGGLFASKNSSNDIHCTKYKHDDTDKYKQSALKCSSKVVFQEPFFSLGALNTGHVISTASQYTPSNSGSENLDSVSLCSVTSDVTDDFSWSDVDSLKDEVSDKLSEDTASVSSSGINMEVTSTDDGTDTNQHDRIINTVQQKNVENVCEKQTALLLEKTRKLQGVNYNTDQNEVNETEITAKRDQNIPQIKQEKLTSQNEKRSQLRKAVSTPSIGSPTSSNPPPSVPIYRTGTPRYIGRPMKGRSCMDIRAQAPPVIKLDSVEDEDTDENISENNSAHSDILSKKKQQLEALQQEKKKLKLKIALKQPRQSNPGKQSVSNSPGSPQTYARFKNIQALSLEIGNAEDMTLNKLIDLYKALHVHDYVSILNQRGLSTYHRVGAELEAVTNLYTLCNGQQQAKIIKKATAPMIVKLVADVKEATHVKWVSDKDLAQEHPAVIHEPIISTDQKPTKSILKSPDHISPFQYAEEPLSPVVVRKLAKKSSSMNEVDPSKM